MGKSATNNIFFNRVFLCGCMTIVVLFCACSEEQPLDGLDGMSRSISSTEVQHEITLEDALALAQSVLGETNEQTLNLSYLYDTFSKPSRGIDVDTLAYVINAEDNNGYAIIAKKAIPQPVLSYSNTGSFDIDNLEEGNPVYDMFVSKLPAYLSFSFRPVDPNDPFYQTTHVVPPLMNIEPWYQRGIFSKYVEIEHPGCPVGCVPLAMVYTMLYSSDIARFAYFVQPIHDGPLVEHVEYEVNFRKLRDALETYKRYKDNPDLIPSLQVKLDNSMALDSIAKVLVKVGELTHTTYSTSGSYPNPLRIVPAYKDLGFNCEPQQRNPDGWATYTGGAVADAIVRGNMVIAKGKSVWGPYYHAWVIDGVIYNYAYTITEENKGFEHIMIHCNWGWEGAKYNGYYSSDIIALRNPEGYVIDGYDVLGYLEICNKRIF